MIVSRYTNSKSLKFNWEFNFVFLDNIVNNKKNPKSENSSKTGNKCSGIVKDTPTQFIIVEIYESFAFIDR